LPDQDPDTTTGQGVLDNSPQKPNLPIGIPAKEGGPYKVIITNKSNVALRIKSVRFSNDDPVVFSMDFLPGNSQEVIYFGSSECVFAAWTANDGVLRVYKSIPIPSNTAIYFKVEDKLPVLVETFQ
jgi:hypothetical protein